MEERLEKIIDFALKNNATYAEVRYNDTMFKIFVLKNGKLDEFVFGSVKGIGVRVFTENGIGFSSTNNLTTENLIETCKKALKLAKVKRKEKISIQKERAYHDTCIIKPQIHVKDVVIEEILNEIKDLDRGIIEKEKRVANRMFIINLTHENKFFINSEQSKIIQEWPITSITRFLTIFDPQKGALQRFYVDGGKKGWEIFKEINLHEVIPQEVKKLGYLIDNSIPLKEKGYYDLVIDGEITGLISHEACGHPFECDRILGREAAQGGESYININMLGKEKIANEILSIIDDPTIERASGFYIYDEEGIPSRKKYLIKNGIVNEFLLNRETAAYLSLKSNGSARTAGYQYEPLIRMSNTYIEPKDFKVEEIVEDVKKGIYFKSYMEWNIDDIRWNQRYVGLESYLIENGEIKQPIRNPIIELTTGTLFKNIDAIGNDLKFTTGNCGKGEPMQGVPVWFGGPTIRVRKIWMK